MISLTTCPQMYTCQHMQMIQLFLAQTLIARSNVQLALSIISSRLEDLQLSLSVTKRKNQLCGHFNFLGFIFHKKLHLRPHIDKIARSCFHYTNVLRSLCGVSWGSDSVCLIRIYIGLIRPRIEYLAPLLLDCNHNEMLKLQRIQWKALRIALGVMLSSHILAMEQIANILPIPERPEMLAEAQINKILSNFHHPARQFLFQLATRSHPTALVRKLASKIQSFRIVQIKLHHMFSYPFASLTLKSVVKFCR